MSVDLFLIVKAWQSQCLKLHVMNQLSREQHTSPITLLKPYELHLMARSPALSHTISPLFSLLCFYCWVVRSGPNWLIYSTINWSRAVWLIKTCNRLQGERKGRGGLGYRCYTNDFIRHLAVLPDLQSLGWRFQSLLFLLLIHCEFCNAVGFSAFAQFNQQC